MSEKEGLGREFVSLYMPSGISIDGVVADLKREADLVVSKFENAGVRQRFEGALKNAIQYLRQLKATPENGLALFAGTPTNENLIVEEIEPPQPVTCYFYYADAHFNLDPLRQMLRDQKIVGILALDAKQAIFGLLKGEKVELIDSITSGVSGKTGKGGQSQRRYERERDMALGGFFHRVAEHAAKGFFDRKVNVLLAGGPGQTKNEFLKGEYLHYELSNMLLNTVDTQSAGKDALKEIADKSSEILQNMCGPDERRIMKRLSAELARDDGLATYGLDAVLGALNKGQVQVVLVTNNTNVLEAVALCKKCGQQKTKLTTNKTRALQEMTSVPCEKCGSVDYEVVEKDIVDVFEDLASRSDAAVEVISTESPEKDALTSLGGFAALLRYKQK